MLESIKNIFEFGPKTEYSELIKQVVRILDVRSNEEFVSGHLKNAINIPVDELSQKQDR